MRKLLTAIATLAVLTAGPVVSVVAAPAAQAKDDLVCEKWGKDTFFEIWDPENGPVTVVQATCDQWTWIIDGPEPPPTTPPGLPPPGPGPKPDPPKTASCRDLDRDIKALETRLSDLRTTSYVQGVRTGVAVALERYAASELADARQDAADAARDVSAAITAYFLEVGIDEYVSVETKPGVVVSRPVVPARSQVRTRYASGRALVRAMDAQQAALVAEHAREVDHSTAAADLATARAAQAATTAAIARAEQQLRDAQRAREGCKP